MLWIAVAALGASALGVLALSRGEEPSVLWFVVAAVCVYSLSYRFYSRLIAVDVLELDDAHITPAIRLDNRRDYTPTPQRITFSHHIAAIAAPRRLLVPVS